MVGAAAAGVQVVARGGAVRRFYCNFGGVDVRSSAENPPPPDD